MTNISKTILFFGTDSFSAVSLRALIDAGYSIGAVITKPDSRKGRGRELAKPLVKEIAEQHGIPVWQPVKVVDIAALVEQMSIETSEQPLGVLVSYGKIIPQSIIDLFSPGIVNVHPSLLPRYRGPSPVESAILHGDENTGVTIMQLSAAMDAGPLFSQVSIDLDGTETGPQLEDYLAKRGADELCRILPSIIDGSLTPTPQNDSEASYCQLLRKEDALIDPTQLSAAAVERQVRAYLAFPKTKIALAGHTVVVTKAHVASEGATLLDIQCADGAYVCIDELVGPSGRTMSASAFLNGYATQR